MRAEGGGEEERAVARPAAADAKPGAKKSKTTDEEEYVDEEEDDDDASDDEDEKRESAGDEAAAATTTAEAKGDAAAAGWQMDYNNYPTSGIAWWWTASIWTPARTSATGWSSISTRNFSARCKTWVSGSHAHPARVPEPRGEGPCDVIGAGDGSGKTLAFGLPILHRLLTQRDEEADESFAWTVRVRARARRGRVERRGTRRRIRFALIRGWASSRFRLG